MFKQHASVIRRFEKFQADLSLQYGNSGDVTNLKSLIYWQ